MKKLFLALALVARIAHADVPSDIAYYQQFFYTTSEDADGNVSTQYLMGTTATKPAAGTFFSIPLNNGNNADLSIYLVQNGNYVVQYNEMQPNGFPVVMMQNYFGTWTVPAAQLLLGDFATGTRAIDYQGQNAIQITFLKDLVSPGLAGKSALFVMGFSNIPLPQQ